MNTSGINRSVEPSSSPRVNRLSSSADFVNLTTGEIDTAGLMAALDEKLEDLSAVEFKLRQSAKSEVALRRELSKQHADDPRADQIREILEYWIVACHKNKQTKIPMDGARAQKVKSRLNQGFTADELKEAIDGCAKLPFVGPHGRVATNAPGTQRQDDIELILRDETYVDRFRGYAKQPADLQERRDRAALERGVQAADEKAEQRDQRRAQAVQRSVTFGDRRAPWDKFIDALRTNGSDVVMYEGNPDAFKAQCPSHEDRDPSLGINRAADGRVLVFCRAGCDTADVLAALGLRFSDLYENTDRDHAAKDFGFRVKADPSEDRPPYSYDRPPVVPAHLQQAMRDLLRVQEDKAA